MGKDVSSTQREILDCDIQIATCTIPIAELITSHSQSTIVDSLNELWDEAYKQGVDSVEEV